MENLAEKEKLSKEDKRFEVDTDDKACWALKQIKKKKEKIEQKKELAESQKYQVNEWLKDETSKLKDSIEYFEGLLREYALQLKKKDKDFKTHSLPFGKLQFRKQRKKWKYENEKLLKSLENAGFDEDSKLIKVKKKITKKELKSLIKNEESPFEIIEESGQVVNLDTGEVLEGVTVTERGEKFSVKVK